MIPAPADDVIEALATAILESGAATLALSDLLTAWNAVDAGWAATTGGRVRLADALHRLHTQGVIELPSPRGSRWDLTLPRLPTAVAVPINRRPRSAPIDPAGEMWVPSLSWAASWIRSTRPPHRLRVALATVNRWFAANAGRVLPTVCREERSLEVFDDEKALASLSLSRLCGPGRLSLELLRCEPPIGGIRVARLACEGAVLVVENKATFDSVWRALRGRVADGLPPGYAAVVFGGGDQGASLVPDLRQLNALVGVRPTTFEYAGDVDVAGVSAAAAFVGTARAAGLDARPAWKLWEALAAKPPAGEDLSGDARERAAAVVATAQLGLPPQVTVHLKDGVRVPQERIDRSALADTSWWLPSLTGNPQPTASRET